MTDIEMVRTLRDGSEVTTVVEPTDTAGLIVAPVIVKGDQDGEYPGLIVADEQWIVLHERTARPIQPLAMPRVIAHQAARELGATGLDWTVDLDVIRGSDPAVPTPYLAAVRAAVSKLSAFIGLTDSEFADQHHIEVAS